MPTDDAELYDGRIDTGRYYVEPTSAFALEGNGWYCDSVVGKALGHKFITSGNAMYQLKTAMSLKTKLFNKFVLEVHNKSENHTTNNQRARWVIRVNKNKTSTLY